VDATDTVIDALAVMRLSRLVREDTIFDHVRYRLVIHHRCSKWFPKFIKCPWCVSMWCGFAVAIGRRFAPRLWSPLALALASSYAASLAAVHLEPHDHKPEDDVLAEAQREPKPGGE
jgi:hypothetical protein